MPCLGKNSAKIGHMNNKIVMLHIVTMIGKQKVMLCHIREKMVLIFVMVE